jgi:putative membrane-bound dehydrogenase-like protein
MPSRNPHAILAAAVSLAACSLALGAEPVADPPRGVGAITVPAGFSVELVAAPPLVERPMLAAFDDAGRLYVCDSAGVNLRGPELSANPPHVIRRLEDTDGDGRFDTSHVFADKMVFPQGIEWHDGAVYCSSPPSFWRLEDADGDGSAERREELVTGFANTGVADDMHGASLGPDGLIYWCAGRFPHEIHRPGGPVIHKGTAPLILRCRPDGSELEVVCGSQGNAVGVAFSRSGEMFASGTFLAPNSMGAGLRDALVHLVDGAEYPVRDRTLNEHRRTGDLLPPLTHLGVSASSDLVLHRSGTFGQEYQGNLFSALFNMHKIMRHRLETAGASFTCRNEDFLVSTDPDFHPTDVFEDADGSLLVIDTGGWFRIGCPTSQVAKPDVLGGVYRVRRTEAKPPDDPRGQKFAWESLSSDDLCRLLGDPRFAVRDRAVARLAKRGQTAVPALARVLAGNASEEPLCAAVWALSRIDGDAARAATREALAAKAPSVRQASARSAGLHRDAAALDRLAELVKNDAPPVRREAATALGRIGQSAAVPHLLTALGSVENDRFLEHAVIFALIGIGDREATARGLETADSRIQRGALIALDQMNDGRLTPEVVTPYLSPADPLLRQTALWVIAHHADWGGSMLDFFRGWLARRDMDDSQHEALRQQLAAFADHAAVQDLIAAAASDANTPPATRLLLVELMAQAPDGKLPASWGETLRAALVDADERIVRAAISALRALPLDKRPLVSRVDPRVDYGETVGNFAGTKLADNFCVRWTGLIRCPLDGAYTFYTNSDDGSRLFIDGHLVVDNGGSHALRERQGQIDLAAGEHEVRLEFVEEEGEAACILSWAFEGREKEVVPADVLFHRAASGGAASLAPGLAAEFYELGGPTETFPDPGAVAFDEPLVRLALDDSRPLDVRVQAAAAVTRRLPAVEAPLFALLRESLSQSNPPLVRLDAALALGAARLDDSQLGALCQAIPECGALELPKLVRAFEQSADAEVGRQLLAALHASPGRKSLAAESLAALVAGYPAAVREAAQPLVAELTLDTAAQKAKLAALEGVLAGGEIQRGRDLFFGNAKAICATCHTVQGQGGKTGPDLSKIGAIRAPRDLLEAIVLPSASFARGYEPFTIVTDAGQVHSGVIVRETADAVHLFTSERIEIPVRRDAIETLAQSTVSIMPAGMDEQLSRQDLADLIAFLQSLR